MTSVSTRPLAFGAIATDGDPSERPSRRPSSNLGRDESRLPLPDVKRHFYETDTPWKGK
jgi:hypothetical protein